MPCAAAAVRPRWRRRAPGAAKGTALWSAGCACAAPASWGRAASATRAPWAPAPAGAPPSRAPAAAGASACAGSACATRPPTERCTDPAASAVTSPAAGTAGCSAQVRTLSLGQGLHSQLCGLTPAASWEFVFVSCIHLQSVLDKELLLVINGL